MKGLYNLLAIALFLTLAACGGSDECVVKCDVEGLGNKGIEVMYADRGVKRLSFHPVDGKVEMRMSLPRPTMLEAFTLDNTPLFCIIARDGEEISVKMKLGEPASLKVEGNEPSAAYAAIVSANDSILRHGTEAEVNALVAREIKAAPGSMASTMLLINHFRTPGHELSADSLLNTILPEARPVWLSGSYASLLGTQIAASVKNEIPNISIHTGNDTTVRFNSAMQSYGLLVFSDTRKPDSIVDRLKSLRKDMPLRRLAIVDISLARDSARWKEAVATDSATWQQAWAPGGAGAHQIRTLSIPTVPFYIVSDSSGHYVYRGRSLHTADTLLRSRLATSVKPSKDDDSETPVDTIKKAEPEPVAKPKEIPPVQEHNPHKKTIVKASTHLK